MANILEFLRGLMTEPEAQSAFQADPDGYIEKAGFVDLTGEDVVEAVLVLRRSLPEDLATRLSAFEEDDELPAVRPGPEETELDAAVRMLHFAIRSGGTATPAGAPIDVENELDTDLADAARTAPTAPLAAGATTASPADTLQRFTDDVDTIVGDTAEALEKAVAAMHDAVAAAVGAADAHARQMRAEADVERESARLDAERVRTEADNELQRAREQAEQSRRRADDLVATAQAESDATHAELAARRAELREVERQLKQRLSDIDSLFRTALGDEGDAPTT